MSKRNQYFTKDHIKLISPSTQTIALENKDISFFVKHYGNTQDKFTENRMKQLEENTKYFMSQVQPLIEENFRLKDTIINLSQAITYSQELVIELVRMEDPYGESREVKLHLATMEQLTQFILEDKNHDDNLINNLHDQELKHQQKQITQVKEMIELNQSNTQFEQRKNEETENHLKEYKKRDHEMMNKCQALDQKIINLNNEQDGSFKTIDRLEKQCQLLHAQIVELKKKIEEGQRNLVAQDKKSLQEKTEANKKQVEEVKQLKIEQGKESAEIRSKYQIKQLEMQAEMKDKDEKLDELQVKLNDEMRKSGWEIQQLEIDYKTLCAQYEQIKLNEFTHLDKLAQVMVEKRLKENQLTEVEEYLGLIQEELRQFKHNVTDNQIKHDKLEEDSRQKIINLIKSQNQKINSVVQENLDQQDRNNKKHAFDTQKIKQEFDEDFNRQNLSKNAQIEEITQQKDVLFNQYQDLQSDIKTQDDMWNFKYVTMELKLQRQLSDIESSSKVQIKEDTRRVQQQQLTQQQDLTESFNLEIQRIQQEHNYIKEQQQNILKQQIDKSEMQSLQFGTEINQLQQENVILQKRQTEISFKAQHDIDNIENKLRSQQTYHEDQIISLNQINNDKILTIQKQLMIQSQLSTQDYELQLKVLQIQLSQVQEKYEFIENQNKKINVVQVKKDQIDKIDVEIEIQQDKSVKTKFEKAVESKEKVNSQLGVKVTDKAEKQGQLKEIEKQRKQDEVKNTQINNNENQILVIENQKQSQQQDRVVQIKSEQNRPISPQITKIISGQTQSIKIEKTLSQQLLIVQEQEQTNGEKKTKKVQGTEKSSQYSQSHVDSMQDLVRQLTPARVTSQHSRRSKTNSKIISTPASTPSNKYHNKTQQQETKNYIQSQQVSEAVSIKMNLSNNQPLIQNLKFSPNQVKAYISTYVQTSSQIVNRVEVQTQTITQQNSDLMQMNKQALFPENFKLNPAAESSQGQLSENSINIFDNQDIVDRVKVDVIQENSYLQEYVSRLQLDDHSQQKEHERSVQLLYKELENLQYTVQSNKDINLYKEKDENQILKRLVSQYQNDSVPQVVGYYESQILDLQAQIIEKNDIISRISNDYKQLIIQDTPKLELNKSKEIDVKKSNQFTLTENNIELIINKTQKLGPISPTSVIKKEYENYRALQQYQNGIFLKEFDALKQNYKKLLQEKNFAELQLSSALQQQSEMNRTSDVMLKPIFPNPVRRYDKNFLSKFNREFTTQKQQLINDFGDQLNIHQLVDLNNVNKQYHTPPHPPHPPSPVHARFNNDLRPNLPNYFIDQQNRELQLIRVNKNRQRQYEFNSSQFQNEQDSNQDKINISDEMHQHPRGYCTSQHTTRGQSCLVDQFQYKQEESIVDRNLNHMDHREGMHSKEQSRTKSRILMKKRQYPSVQRIQEFDELKIEGTGDDILHKKQRIKNPGFIESLKIKKDGDRAKRHPHQQRGTSTEALPFLSFIKVASVIQD